MKIHIKNLMLKLRRSKDLKQQSAMTSRKDDTLNVTTDAADDIFDTSPANGEYLESAFDDTVTNTLEEVNDETNTLEEVANDYSEDLNSDSDIDETAQQTDQQTAQLVEHPGFGLIYLLYSSHQVKIGSSIDESSDLPNGILPDMTILNHRYSTFVTILFVYL